MSGRRHTLRRTAHKTTELRLKKFNEKRKSRVLFRELGLNPTNSLVSGAFRLFHGHPFLTQIFAWELRDGASQEQATNNATNLTGSYEMHWERLKSEITFRIRDKGQYSVATVLAVVWGSNGRSKLCLSSAVIASRRSGRSGTGMERDLHEPSVWWMSTSGQGFPPFANSTAKPSNERAVGRSNREINEYDVTRYE